MIPLVTVVRLAMRMVEILRWSIQEPKGGYFKKHFLHFHFPISCPMVTWLIIPLDTSVWNAGARLRMDLELK